MQQDLVEKLSKKLEERKLTLVTAESCTGGLIAAAITGRPGASSLFERGFVTYSNEAKIEMLGVPAETIEKHGAVSEETAEAMVKGALAHSLADVAIAVTGIAGPTGGSDGKPVGLVYIGYGLKSGPVFIEKHRFDGGDRKDIREKTLWAALVRTTSFLDENA